MGYSDDFYTAANVVGYTGDINNNPTFYFMTEKDGMKTFGHITQAHGLSSNVGREEVKSARDYELKNAWVHTVSKDNHTQQSDYNIDQVILEDGRHKMCTTKEGKSIGFERKSVEIWDGKIQHPSRSLLTKVDARNLNQRVSAALRKALKNPLCQEMKNADEIAMETYRKENGIDAKQIQDNEKEIDEMVKTFKQKDTKQPVGQKKDNKSTPDKQVDENVLNALSSGNAKKLAQKQDLSKDPKLEKPLVQNQEFGFEDLASPGFRKNKRAKQNTRSTGPNKSGDNKTRQRRNSSKGPSKQF